MPFYFVPLIDTGEPDIFGRTTLKRPLGLEPRSSALILGLSDAVVQTSGTLSDGRAKFLGDSADELTAAATKLAMRNFRGDSKPIPDRLGDAIADMLVDPPNARWAKYVPLRSGLGEVRCGFGLDNIISRNTGLSRPDATRTLVDSFDRANGNLAGTGLSDASGTWNLIVGTAANDQITSNQVLASSATIAGNGLYIASVPLDTPDQYAQVDFVAFGGGATTTHRQDLAVWIRANHPDYTAVYIATVRSGSAPRRFVQDAGNSIELAFDTTDTTAPGTLYTEWNGSNFVMKWAGTAILSGTNGAWDGSGAQKFVGVNAYRNLVTAPIDTVTYDNFRAGDLSTAPTFSWANFKKPKLARADWSPV